MRYKSYNDLERWKEIMDLFPQHNQIDQDSMPEEIIWDWEGNKIHIDHYRNSAAPVKVISLHGVGGNGRLISFINAPLFKRKTEVISPDLPGYGISFVPHKRINWSMWRRLAIDLIDHELRKDNRPIVLFGLSAGGMLAYQATCINQKVAGVVFSTLLDQRIPKVIETSAIHPLMGKLGAPTLKVLAKVFPTFQMPMRFVANIGKIVNDDRYLQLLVTDKQSAGAAVPLELIASMTDATPALEPEHFDVCPVLLAHPDEDRWTPVEISRLFFDRLKCPKKLVMLENAGHLPVEQPGLSQLEDAVVEFTKEIAKREINAQ